MWHIDVLKTPSGTLDIGLIGDEVNEFAPSRRPHIEVHPLGENLATKVVQAQGANSGISKPTYTISVESIPSGSTSLSSSPSIPSATLVPLARVKKFEAQMSTLLHHIEP